MDRSIVFVVGLTLLTTACASAGGGTRDGGVPTRWTGSFQPQQQTTGTVAATGTARIFGNFSLTPGPTPNYSVASLTITTPEGGNQFGWAILPSRCGSASLPLLSIDRFPPIETSGSGRGAVNQNLSLTFPTTGSYHVNVYRGRGTELSDVVACANLSAG